MLYMGRTLIKSRKHMSKKTRAFIAKKFEKELEINQHKAQEGIHDLIIVLDHLKGNFNMGKIIRTCETFSIKEVHIIGTKFFDPTTAKGALKRVKIYWYDDIDESISRLKKLDFKLIAFDSKAKEFLGDRDLPKKSAFLFGHEEFGPLALRDGKIKEDDVLSLKIRQYGLTESLNVSVAASIAMYDYIRVYGEKC